MKRKLNISLAQLNWIVGDIEGNCDRMIKTFKDHTKYSDIIMFSELSLTGYPPKDLIFRVDFKKRCLAQLKRLQKISNENTAIIVGHPHYEKKNIYNTLSFFYNGNLVARYFKQKLFNYWFFNEFKYFSTKQTYCIINFKNYILGMMISKDIFYNKHINVLKNKGIELLLVISASPFNVYKKYNPDNLLINCCKKINATVININQIGGQDELIFDGNSKIVSNKGKLIYKLFEFKEQIDTVYFNDLSLNNKIKKNKKFSTVAKIYKALVLATRDYVNKNNFNGIILGLSGGIDSGVAVTIAVDAIGKEKVKAIMMPSRYTTKLSINNTKKQTKLLNIKLYIISINQIFNVFMNKLYSVFENKKLNPIVEENLQARCRAIILMAISNQFNKLVLTTSNKSEISVGYSTLYGDMAGGFNILKDIPKTLVFKLAKYRNTISKVIPNSIINRKPSAELSYNQLDQDTLPPYNILDKILKLYIEKNLSKNELFELGFNKNIVQKIIYLIDHSEYKRHQSPIGPKIVITNFYKNNCYPITSLFNNKIN